MNYFILARQSLPFRGDWNKENGSEHNSNFHQMLLVRAEEEPEIVQWLKRKHNKFTSPEIQNEMMQVYFFSTILFTQQIVVYFRKEYTSYSCNVKITSFVKVFALRILRDIASNIRSSVFYTVMADETADVSNKEQLVICIRWVDDDLTAHEDFIGMLPIERTTADVIVRVLKVHN